MTKKVYNQPVSHQQKARTSSGLVSLLWMLVGAVIAVMIGFFLYLSPLFDSFKTEVDVNPPAKVEPLPQKAEAGNYEFYEVLPNREFQTGENVTGTDKITEEVSTKEIKPDAVLVDENFDENAGNQNMPVEENDEDFVTVTEEEVTYDNETVGGDGIKITATKNSYILQIRSYDNPDEADRMRAEVMMSGVDARIIKRMDNGMELYQVISNTINSKEEVLRLSQQLSNHGIDSLIVEQRR